MSATHAIPPVLTSDYERRVFRAKAAIYKADHILIGGGAGLSDAAGLHFTGSRFTDNFADFIARYGFDDLYTSSFYPFPSREEKWAYWAKHISINRYEIDTTELYQDLFSLVRGKEYFVLTTNVDAQFEKAGFPQEKIFAVQGDYGYLQCAKGCHDRLYYNEGEVAEMLRLMEDCKIPSVLIPQCPVCGGEMDAYVHKDQYFVRDKRWRDSEKCYTDFLRACRRNRLVLLELGVGFNTPGIIRFPFEELAYENKKSVLVRANRDYPRGAAENAARTIAFSKNMAELVRGLLH
jgi:NAD-dependent SIR2 family protein deacetylase